MAGETNTTRRGSEYVYEALVEAGVELVVGLPGTQTLALDRTVARRDEMKYVMARHEGAIPHIAWGYHEAGGHLAATVTVPGPGDTNAAHGLKNALDDSVPLVHISADSDPDVRGRHPIHEIDPSTFDNVVKANFDVTDGRRLRESLSRAISTALTPPMGPVRVGISSSLLASSVDAPPATVTPERTTYDNESAYARATRLLAESTRPVVYVGGGARRSPGGVDGVTALVEQLGAPVVASYKGQGVFPEDDDRFVGVTGADLPPGGVSALEHADMVLALGTDFDGLNTAEWTLPMGESVIHVDVDPAEIGAVYDAEVGIVDDVATACESLTRRLESATGADAWSTNAVRWDGAALASDVRAEYNDHLRNRGLLDEGPPLSTPGVMQTVRDVVPDETIVTTDVGGHRIWSKNAFPAYCPEQFVTAGSWAGMGVGLPAAIGARLSNPDRPVLTLSGDGSLFMCASELHTAAENDISLAVVVFNDGDYGAISKSPKFADVDAGFDWTSPDWVKLAESYGCLGRRAETRSEVSEAVEWALDTDGPTLVDVSLDPDEPTAAEAAAFETELDPRAY